MFSWCQYKLATTLEGKVTEAVILLHAEVPPTLRNLIRNTSTENIHKHTPHSIPYNNQKLEATSISNKKNFFTKD